MDIFLDAVVERAAFLNALPAEWPERLLPAIRASLANDPGKVVILDDDPTGTQTVYNVPVLTGWSIADLTAELDTPSPAFFILTNSRSLSPEPANALAAEIGANLWQASALTGVPVSVISRSDSTLRGHFPGEVDALAAALGHDSTPRLLVPFFLEGGRFTIGDVHFVAEGDQLIPAAQTPYALDSAFGYRNSNMRAWLEEKTSGRISAHQVRSISIDEIRRCGPLRVADVFESLQPGSVCVVNAASYADLEVVVMGLLWAQERGVSVLPRSAASFVRVRLGLDAQPLLTREQLIADTTQGGLFVVGSYVPKTTAQLAALLAQHAICAVELNVERLLDRDTRDMEVASATEMTRSGIIGGQDVVLFTSRTLIMGTDAQQSLSIGRQVSTALVEIVAGLCCQPRYLVAKGGITSSDIATRALGVKRALVLGQLLPGTPVWQLGAETAHPGMSYVVFPGNVGDDDALCRIQQMLSNSTG